jgi:hypothetical protein
MLFTHLSLVVVRSGSALNAVTEVPIEASREAHAGSKSSANSGHGSPRPVPQYRERYESTIYTPVRYMM